MRPRTTALRAIRLLTARRPHVVGAVLASLLVAGPALAAKRVWEVTFAIRVSVEDEEPITLRLALPAETPLQELSQLRVTSRGLDPQVEREGEAPHVRFSGTIEGARRLAVAYRIRTERPPERRPPRIEPVEDPSPELLPYLVATPLLQARSIIVREFLETHVAPLLDDGETNVMRAIYTATRQQIEHDAEGKTLVLDVVRRKQAQRIGIERAFTTFLRCAGIPARFVEGIRLSSSTRRKRVFWTEVWDGEGWWPVSASRGWLGRPPSGYVALSRDGVRVLEVEGEAESSYTVEARRLKQEREREDQ